MTATDELRRMLDERGVELRDDSSIYGTRRTVWTANGVTYVAAEVSGRLKVSGYLTPEQAIEATLWRGTCEPVDGYDDDGEEIGTCCSECGSPWPVYYVVRYCPVCGCKVVED